MKIYRKFNQALKWNTIEVLVYQISLYLHSKAVAVVVGSTFYGAVGTVFSLIFLFIPILGFGFDKALISNFKSITANKQNFKKFFLFQLGVQVLLLGAALPLFLLLENPLDLVFCKPQSCLIMSKYMWAIAALTVVSEGIRRSLKLIIQLAFKSKYTSIIETGLLGSYIAIVWSSYFTFGTITFNWIFVPFLTLSLVSLVAYTIICINLYGKVESGNSYVSWRQIIESRSEGYLFQLSSALFSSNMLVPVFAYKYGLEVASTLKLFSYLGGVIISFSEKAFGIAGGALFANLKNKPEEIKLAFKKTRDQFSFIIGLISAIIILVYLTSRHPVYSGYSILFLLALTLENFNIVYEKYFLVQHKIIGIFLINLICALIFFSIFCLDSLSLNQAILSLIFIRAASFATVAKVSASLK